MKVTAIEIVIGTGTLDSIRDKESLQAGTAMKAGKVHTTTIKEAVGDNVKYDLVGRLVESSGLTRKSIVEILTGIRADTFDKFKQNPEEFIIRVGKIIEEVKAVAIIKHIEYHKLEDRFDESIFTENTIRGKLGENAIESTKSLYDLVVVDSAGTEKTFAEQLEKRDEVEVYTKLPRGFKINTPMSSYNPDWAIAFKEGSVKHIYFIAETKGKSRYEVKSINLRGVEDAKVECAKKHFASISDKTIVYDVVDSYEELRDLVVK